MRTITGCCFGHLPVDFRHISTTHVNNCTKVNASVSTTYLMRVINTTLFFLGIADFANYSADVGGVKKYDCPEVKLSKSVGHSVGNL